MYDESIIARRVEETESTLGYRLHRYTPSESAYCVAKLDERRDRKGRLTGLTPDEQLFIQNEIALSRCDFRYFTRYVKILRDDKSGDKGTMTLWSAQEELLRRVGEVERDMYRLYDEGRERFDGNCWYVHKSRQRGLCLKEGTKVLTVDLRWVPIEEIEPGDELIGVDEYCPGGRGASRKMRIAQVVASAASRDATFKITFSDGRTITATAGHRFLYQTRSRGKSADWRTVDTMRVGDMIRNFTAPWGEPTYEDGWFAGLLDGEGSLSSKRTGAGISVTQVAGAVLNRAVAYFMENDYPFREWIDRRESGISSKLGNKEVHKLEMSQMGRVMRMIGKTRPARFIDRTAWWEGKELPNGQESGGTWLEIVAIEPAGVQQVYDLQTTTGTFIAEGVVSHNSSVCQALGVHRVNFWSGMNGLVASTKEDSSKDLWRQYGYFMYRNLPDWLRMPTRTDSASVGMTLENESLINLQYFEQNSGLGQGFKWHWAHLTECATWSPLDKVVTQIENHFQHAVARSIKGMAFLESTSQGSDDWWHTTSNQAREGKLERWRYFFVPWYAIREISIDYPPQGWEPSPETKQEEELIVRTSPEWTPGHATYRPSREQLYWWERTRANAVTQHNLADFYRNHPSTPEQSFMATDRCSFPIEVLTSAERQTREPLAYYDLIGPGQEFEHPDLYPRGLIITEREVRPDGRLIEPQQRYTVGAYELVPVRLRAEEKIKPRGLLSVWETPEQVRNYQTFAGVDTAGGVLGWSRFALTSTASKREPDNAVTQIIRHTHEFDVQVCEFAAPVTPKVQARWHSVIARLWSGANALSGQVPTIVELSAGGVAFNDELVTDYDWFAFYQHFKRAGDTLVETETYGWPPDPTNQRVLWTAGKEDVLTGRAIIRSLPMVNEMRVCQDENIFVSQMQRGKAKEGSGRHDDRVYAWMFASWYANDRSNPAYRPPAPRPATSTGPREVRLSERDMLPEDRERYLSDRENELIAAAGLGPPTQAQRAAYWKEREERTRRRASGG